MFGIEYEFSYLFFVIVLIGIFADNKNLLCLVLFSAIHEIGHILVLYIIGGKPDKIVVSYYGIGMTHSSMLTPSKEIIFLFSGIFINLTFAILNICREINIKLVIMNSLPIYPLDMGRILKCILDTILPVSISYKVYFIVGWVFELLLLGTAIYLKNINLFFISLYLIFVLVRGNL